MKSMIAVAHGRSAVRNGKGVLFATLLATVFGVTGCQLQGTGDDPSQVTAGASAGESPGGAIDAAGGGSSGTENGGTTTGGTTTGGTTTGGTTTGGTTTGGTTTGGTTTGGTTTGGTTTGGTTTDGTTTDGTTTGGTTTGGTTTDGTTTGGTTTGGTTTPVTGSVHLSWLAPTERESGDPLPVSELNGYRIYYGPVGNPKANVISVGDPILTSYTISGLPAGTWQVAVSAVDTGGTESGLSNSLSKTIQ